MRRCLSLLLLLIGLSSASAQIRVSIDAERTNYLLFAPVVVKVILHNGTEQDIILKSSDAEHNWLSFLVLKPDGFPVHPDLALHSEPLLLKAGEAKAMAVNLTPHYAFRDPGNYRVQAAVDVPGLGQLVSSNYQFNVLRGQKIWSKTRTVDGSERNYTLLRFAPDNLVTELYLRVDDVKQNLVYSNVLVGQIIAIVEPQTAFDAEGRLHILHTAAQGSYLYTRLTPSGQVENQSRYESLPEYPPRLTQATEGGVMVVGGRVESDENRRERLSEAKFGLDAPSAAVPVSQPEKPAAAGAR